MKRLLISLSLFAFVSSTSFGLSNEINTNDLVWPSSTKDVLVSDLVWPTPVVENFSNKNV